MLILNFSHPITPDQHTDRAARGYAHSQIAVQIAGEPLSPQVAALVNTVGLAPDEWQTTPLLINPPGYALVAFVLLAELHGRIGHFPALLRLRSRQGPVTAFEVAELLNLQTVREMARKRRV